MPTQSTKEYRAPLAAAAGSICVGTVPSVAMGLYADGFDPQSLLFWRYWLALAVLVPLAALSGARLADEWRRAGHALFLNSVSLGVVQTFTYFRAIQTLPSSVAVTIFFMYPVVTVVLDRLSMAAGQSRSRSWPSGSSFWACCSQAGRN